MSTLLEVDAAVDALPVEQQQELLTRVNTRLARTRNSSEWPDLQIDLEFSRLTSAWRRDTELSSSLTEISTHPAYQRIVGMGCLALPLIFQELAREPDHWFWALKAITGCDPVPPSHRGDLELMAADWLEWGRSRGYVAS